MLKILNGVKSLLWPINYVRMVYTHGLTWCEIKTDSIRILNPANLHFFSNCGFGQERVLVLPSDKTWFSLMDTK